MTINFTTKQLVVANMIFLIFGVILLSCSEGRLQCKNTNNQDIDWFVIYKLPKNEKSTNDLIRKGVGFTYITSDDTSVNWKLGNESINSSDTLIAYTLEPLYDEETKKDFIWLLYNDETPNKTVSFTLGHTKGVIMASEEEGFWLVHSVPRFPNISSSKFIYPRSGTFYGQSFLCISMPATELNKIGNQLKYNTPQIFGSNVPAKYETLYPNIISAIAKSWVKSAPWNHLQEFFSLGGMSFHSFAKSRNFKKDLYADWVAPILKQDLAVETWPNGPGRLPSECLSPFKVYNIQDIVFTDYNIAFSNHMDHSKWSIAVNSTAPWVCIGDINRMVSQERRGGGTVCMKNLSIWSAYKRTIEGIESCPKL